MARFRRKKKQDENSVSPSPLVNEICARLGVTYGGFDTIEPLMGAEKGMRLHIHVNDGTVVEREPYMKGTGIMREGRAVADRVEVWDNDTLVATYADLTVNDVFAE